MIAEATYALLGWGVQGNPAPREPRPSGAYECVAVAASKLGLRRGDGGGLSSKRVEQIYGEWHKAETDAWIARSRLDELPPEGERFRLFPPKVWSNYTRQSLQEQLPEELRSRSAAELAALLLSGWVAEHKEEWAERRFPPLEFAPEHLRQVLERMPMPASVRAALSWRPKRGRPKKRRLA